MSIKRKIVIAMLLPLTIVLALVGLNITSALGEKAESAKLVEITALADTLGDFLHESQKERGATAGYLASDRDPARKSKVLEQRRATDSKIEPLRETIASIDFDHFSESAQKKVGNAKAMLDRLDDMRGQIDSGRLGVTDAISYYSSHHLEWIETVEYMGKQITNGDVVHEVIAYVNLELAKEKMGIARAVGMANSLSGEFDVKGFAKFVSLSAQIDAYTHTFELEAPKTISERFHSVKEGSSYKQVGALSAAFVEAGPGVAHGVDPDAWWDAISQKINDVKAVEREFVEYFGKDAKSIASSANANFMFQTGLALFCLVGCLVTQKLIGRSILNPLSETGDAVDALTEQIGSGDQSSSDMTIGIERSDEIGELVTHISALVDAVRLQGERRAEELEFKVNQLLKVAQSASAGDLTAEKPFEGEDSMGQLAGGFDAMFDQISGVLNEVIAGSEQIDIGAQQFASASQQLSEGASQQAAALEEIAASLEEVGSMIAQNAENAKQASALSEEAQTNANRGSDEMNVMNQAMDGIKESSEEISKVIKVIDDIAFQTNLLALNAAVEAARAGEHGKGFAVVAEEVRNLAQRSAEAAKETAAMIEQSVERANNGVQIAGRVGDALTEIVGSSRKVNALLSEIASASQEQAEGVDQVNKGVTDLDKVTQQNAGNSEELAAGAQETAAQVASLRETVSGFKTRGCETPSRAVAVAAAPPKAKAESAPAPAASAKPSKTDDSFPMDDDEGFENF